MAPEHGPQAPPRLSVIMPVYNGAAYLADAVRSVLTQTFTDFELIAVDDGSSDGSGDILRAFSDPRLRIERHPRNRGLSAAMNTGLFLARGQYVAHCEQDDLSRPHRFETQLAYLDAHPDIDFLGAFIQGFGAHGEVLEFETEDWSIKTRLIDGLSAIGNPVVVYRRDFAVPAGLRYDPALRVCCDYDFWLSAMAAGARFAGLRDILLDQRFHPASTTAANVATMCEDFLHTRRRAIDLFFPKAAEEARQVAASAVPYLKDIDPALEDHDAEVADLARKAAAVTAVCATEQKAFGQDHVNTAGLLQYQYKLLLEHRLRQGRISAADLAAYATQATKLSELMLGISAD